MSPQEEEALSDMLSKWEQRVAGWTATMMVVPPVQSTERRPLATMDDIRYGMSKETAAAVRAEIMHVLGITPK